MSIWVIEWRDIPFADCVVMTVYTSGKVFEYRIVEYVRKDGDGK